VTGHVLVTGTSGFIGSNLTDKLQNNYKLIGQVRNRVKSRLSRFPLFELEIDATSDWKCHLQDVHTIVHLAAIAHNNSNDLTYINEVNVKATINLAKQGLQVGVKRFIFLSSIGVLGNTSTEPFDEKSSTFPHSEYAKSKLKAERALLELAFETGLEVVIIRPVLVYGQNAPGNFGKLVKLIQKVPFIPFGLCENKRSFISIDNLVDFIDVCISHPKAANEIFCISDGVDVSIREFTDEIANGLSKKLIQLPIPVFLFKLLGCITGKSNLIEQLIGNLQVDSSKARTLLDWAPPKTMTETLSKLVKVK